MCDYYEVNVIKWSSCDMWLERSSHVLTLTVWMKRSEQNNRTMTGASVSVSCNGDTGWWCHQPSGGTQLDWALKVGPTLVHPQDAGNKAVHILAWSCDHQPSLKTVWNEPVDFDVWRCEVLNDSCFLKCARSWTKDHCCCGWRQESLMCGSLLHYFPTHCPLTCGDLEVFMAPHITSTLSVTCHWSVAHVPWTFSHLYELKYVRTGEVYEIKK